MKQIKNIIAAFVLAAAFALTPAQAFAAEMAPAAEVAVTDEQKVQDITTMILALQTVLPEGTPFTNEANVYQNYPVWPYRGRGCAAFAMQVSDAVYGADAPVSMLYEQTADDIQPGDVVRIGGVHTVVAVSVDADSITVCEGNYNASVHWGRVISKQSLAGQITYLARRTK